MTLELILIEIRELLKEIKLNDKCKCCRCGYYRFSPSWVYDPFGTHTTTVGDTANDHTQY